MPVLLASIISGPAVLWCSSVDCERQWDGLKCGHSFVLGCVCWSLALASAALRTCRDRLGKWADSCWACKQKMERPTQFQGEKNLLKLYIGFGLSCRHSRGWGGRWALGSQLLLAWHSIKEFQWWPGAAILQQQCLCQGWPCPCFELLPEEKKLMKRNNRSVTDWSNADEICVWINAQEFTLRKYTSTKCTSHRLFFSDLILE